MGRLRLEGETTKADVVLGLDMNLAAEAKALGLFAPHGVDPKNLSLPISWKDDLFLPFDWGHLAFVYDSSKLPNPPRSLKELVENPNGPKIVLQDPRTSAPGLGFMLWMRKVYGDQAGQAWTQLKPRIVTFTKGWSEAYGLFMKGEADMVLSYTTSPVYHVVAEKKDNFKAASFAEGHYLHVELAGMTRVAKQPDSPQIHDLYPVGRVPIGNAGGQLDDARDSACIGIARALQGRGEACLDVVVLARGSAAKSPRLYR